MEKQEKIINLTPHSVMINGIEIKSSGVVRLQERNENIGTIAGIPVVKQVRGEVEGTFPTTDKYIGELTW